MHKNKICELRRKEKSLFLLVHKSWSFILAFFGASLVFSTQKSAGAICPYQCCVQKECTFLSSWFHNIPLAHTMPSAVWSWLELLQQQLTGTLTLLSCSSQSETEAFGLIFWNHYWIHSNIPTHFCSQELCLLHNCVVRNLTTYRKSGNSCDICRPEKCKSVSAGIIFFGRVARRRW